ncbi:MAG TPA: alkaline phosphatase D family protein [Polyangiaceae bacterium]
MKVDRREMLKLGAAGLIGSTCVARHSASNVPAAAASGDPGPEAEQLVGPKPPQFSVAFGSCNKPALPQPIWGWVRAQKPDAWMWLGDIVYADTENIDRTRSLYAQQSERHEYAAVVAETRIIGIWDDHDFGKNDAGREYPKRVESQAALLDFLGEPPDTPRRHRRGTYESYEFGSGNERVKIILLDGRYHRELPGPQADTLGEEQWAWFEKELRSSSAALTIVASGYQILPEEHHNEKWANFPRAKARLFDVLRRSGTPGVVLVSGDRHFAELSRVDDAGIGYPLHELTSSGLTHSYLNADEPNRHRIGKIYPKLNFGVVRVDWTRRIASIEARGADGSVPIQQKIALDRLRRGA